MLAVLLSTSSLVNVANHLRRRHTVARWACYTLAGHAFVTCQTASASTAPPGFEPRRVEGIGGGFDMLSDQPIANIDVLYPPSLNGSWVCERRVAGIEGDVGQAQGAWKLLGGTGDLQSTERYLVRFIDLRRASDAMTGLDGQRYYGDVFDRGFEIESRTGGATVRWDARAPNLLQYARTSGGPGSAAELLGKEETLGSVQPERFADLVAVKGDPLQNIRVLENLTHVMKDGKLVR